MEINGEVVSEARQRVLIKNKRLISWAYIWRFFVLLIITCLISFSLTFLITDVITPTFLSDNSHFGSIIMSTMKEGVLLYLSGMIVFIVGQIIGCKIIYKAISKRVCLERQNVSYVKKSVLVVIAIAFAFCLYENINAANFDTNMSNISGIKESIIESNDMAQDSLDLLNLGLYNNNVETLRESFSYFLTDYQEVLRTLYISNTIILICIAMIAIAMIIVLIKTSKKISDIATDNTLDENGKPVPTQEKLKKKYKLIYAVSHIIIIVIVIAFIIFNNIDNKDDFTFINQRIEKTLTPNAHTLLNEWEKLTDYRPTKDQELFNDESGEYIDYEMDEEIDEEFEQWKKLEHEDNWYLENDINIGETNKWLANHEEYKNDSEHINYIKSMYPQAKTILGALDTNKSLFEIEKELGIPAKHIAPREFVIIIDNKNLLTGIGIHFKVDSYENRNIEEVKVWDINRIVEKYEERERIDTIKQDYSFDDVLNELYADMTEEEFKQILGEKYDYKEATKVLIEQPYYLNTRNYTWYDKDYYSLELCFSQGILYDAYIIVND